MTVNKEWFGEWFDSPFYHILYKNRDYKEAQLFIDNLVKLLSFEPTDDILDLACGKGRHAIYLHKLGFKVTGVDLSPSNIEFANRFKRIYGDGKLSFHVHDMREIFKENAFNYVLNLFTSFGYFEKSGQNKKAIQSAASSLKKGGKLVIDFFNTTKVIKTLKPFETKIVSGIEFRIQKEVKNGFIIKYIEFDFESKAYSFQEKVKEITQEDFLKYFQAAELRLIDFYGDYHLNKFDPANSDRMIFILQR